MGYQKPGIIPAQTDLQKAVDILNKDSKAAMLIGAGGLGAADEIIQVAELFNIGDH
jgi:pyruvate dehydrogenase (quinone)